MATGSLDETVVPLSVSADAAKLPVVEPTICNWPAVPTLEPPPPVSCVQVQEPADGLAKYHTVPPAILYCIGSPHDALPDGSVLTTMMLGLLTCDSATDAKQNSNGAKMRSFMCASIPDAVTVS
jgi:hypothetical protein